MPPRKSNRTAAASAANSAISTESAEPAAAKSKRTVGRPKRAAAATRKAKSTQASAAEAKKNEASQQSKAERETSPIIHTPAKPGKPEVAPPDTLCISRRSRTHIRGDSSASKPEPKPRRSSKAGRRGTKVAVSKLQVEADISEGDERGGQAQDDTDASHDEHGFSDEALLETPTKRRGKVTPLFPSTKKQQRESLQNAVVSDIEGSPSPKAAPVRGRKRKSDNLGEDKSLGPKGSNGSSASRTPVKRGRLQKTTRIESTDTSAASTSAAADERKDVYVDIVSPSKFETSRSKLRSKMERSDKAADTSISSGESWRVKYEELLELRQSQPEKEYEEFRAKAQERFDAAEDVIGNLRKEVAELKLLDAQQNDAVASAKAVGAANEASAAVESRVRKAIESEFEKQLALLRQQVEALTQDVLIKDEAIERLEKHRRLTETSTDYNLRQKLKVMEEITGLAIENVETEDEGLSFICKQSVGAGVAARYVLTLLDDLPNDYQYDPISSGAMLTMLPSYLQDHISFERRFASMFFWRMCNLLRQSRESPPPPAGVDGDQAAGASQPLAESSGPEVSTA
ncbi:hypothetical protein H4S08_001875 [Coemansia sp. RSA 1365]|nr:hypothetical protein H4S08_001875 [Coemansia sp. RSA 1365]